MLVYRVKIAQRVISSGGRHGFDYFPFDNLYVLPKTYLTSFLRSYEYALSFQLNAPLRKALRDLQVEYTETLPLYRDDQVSTPAKVGGRTCPALWDFLKRGEWVGVVPTYVAVIDATDSRWRETYVPHVVDHNPSTHSRPEVIYIGSKALLRGGWKNTNARLPSVYLHTPTRIIPGICAICSNVMQYHAGTCVPGTPQCIVSARFNTLTDPHTRHGNHQAKVDTMTGEVR